MSQYAGENGLHPRVAGFALSWERGTLSAAGNSWERACFPWIKGHQTPPALLISLFCFYDSWRFWGKLAVFLADAVNVCCRADSRRGFSLCVRVDVDLRGLRGSQSYPTESYDPLDRSYNQYTPHHPPDLSLAYMPDSPLSVFHLSSWSACWQVTIGSCFGPFHHMFF